VLGENNPVLTISNNYWVIITLVIRLEATNSYKNKLFLPKQISSQRLLQEQTRPTTPQKWHPSTLRYKNNFIFYQFEHFLKLNNANFCRKIVKTIWTAIYLARGECQIWQQFTCKMDQIWSLLNNFIWHSPSCQIDCDISPIFVQRQLLNNANFCRKLSKRSKRRSIWLEGMPDLTTIYM
jgi:hypothetical protein